jgi:hypothetical protein
MRVWTNGRMILTGEDQSTGSKSCPSATFSTTDPTRTGLGSNPGFRIIGLVNKLRVEIRGTTDGSMCMCMYVCMHARTHTHTHLPERYEHSLGPTPPLFNK